MSLSKNILIDHQDSAILSSKIASYSDPKMSTAIQKLTNEMHAIGLKQQHHDEQQQQSSSGVRSNPGGSTTVTKKRRSRQPNRSRSRSTSLSNQATGIDNGNHQQQLSQQRPQQQQRQQRDRSNSLVGQKNVRFSLSNPNLSQQHQQQQQQQSLSNSVNHSIQRLFTNSNFNNRNRHRSNSDPDLISPFNYFVAQQSRLYHNQHQQQHRGTMMNSKPGMSKDFVSREIMDYYQRNRQSNDKYKAKQILRESLENTLKQCFPNYFINLHIIGSSTNGIAQPSSEPQVSSVSGDEDKGEDKKDKTDEKEKEKSTEEKVDAVDEEEKVVKAVADSNTDGDVVANENEKEKDNVNVMANEDLELKHIEKILQNKNFAKNIVLIPARVPIIKFQDIICNMNVTLNLNQEVSIRNTQLIRDYSKMDWRFPQLAMIIKEWARENRINSAVEKSISPYSWTLLVIHYLQAIEPPVLPCLQKMSPQRYNIDINIDEERNIWRQPPIKWQSKNNNSLKQLMKGFFRYFGYVFRYDQHIISIREGKVLNRIYHRSSSSSTTTSSSGGGGGNEGDNLAIQWNSLMCVEEPFNRSNTTRCVKDYSTFERIKELLRMSSNALKGNRISLFNIIVDDLDFPIKY
ncbi:Zinc finger, CCHC domain-containing protein [Dermatophagoides pteronyssinus]|uniref:Zinc finger, CCHC domain-containing protein n=1 Tax=Dermatophagoides pteronyssinus TaxID=6956 RepID=A0ABQ8J5B7_DERPT|nr:Zinc finger, CCHC domain-containing protein [Dermatophagoides pteronyssinus]